MSTEPAEQFGAGAPRRPATDAETRAMASGLRLRILRLCLDGAMTNKEIAAALGKDPASVLYHVRRLVDTGFLVPEPVRRGSRGSRERPYRATGKTWNLDVSDPRALRAETSAMIDAFLAEVREADLERVRSARMGLLLTPADLEEFDQRFTALLEEFMKRPPGEGAEPWSVFFAAHPQRRPVETAVPPPLSRDTIEDDD